MVRFIIITYRDIKNTYESNLHSNMVRFIMRRLKMSRGYKK